MAVQEGKVYYFISSPYDHFIARVKAITGKREADMTDVRRVYSCQRTWTEFFRDGARNDTTVHKFADGAMSWLMAFEWTHPIPEDRNASSR